jgi:hypothetical protein
MRRDCKKRLDQYVSSILEIITPLLVEACKKRPTVM